eukprot:TRINITY_DN213_c0_g1_i3.p1 TRINITY_DN213_c0_g1~~TRINITY_DN213_c0_g1_i3.p1  ORF type:complete len:263 (-),score=129.51 TRINITY_DN213_c0_g1_i3:134-922(-)
MSAQFPTTLNGTDNEKLTELCGFPYHQQAVWFLNAFWNEHEGEAEKLWAFVDKCSEFDYEKHEEGCGLDEMNAHRFLEAFDETMTVREMRANLRESGAIGEKERPKVVPLIHVLLFKYNVDWKRLVNSSQGDNAEKIAQAQDRLAQVKEAFKQSEEAAQQAKKALAEAKQREAEAMQHMQQQRKQDKKKMQHMQQQKKQDKEKQQQYKSREEAAVAAAEEAKQKEDAAHAAAEEAKRKEEAAHAAAEEARQKESEAVEKQQQ